MTAELPEFLRARLADDEQVARAATPGPWRAVEMYPDCYFVESEEGPHANVASESSSGDIDPGNARHIARWDPVWVLADIEVKRQIIAMHEHDHSCVDAVGMDDYAFTGPPHHIHCITLRLLALPYAAHPDYRPEWAPDAVVTMTDTPHAPQRERLGETRVMAVLCSDGPENGARVELSGTAVGALEIGHERRVFRWDGTYDEHGDARYRPS